MTTQLRYCVWHEVSDGRPVSYHLTAGRAADACRRLNDLMGEVWEDTTHCRQWGVRKLIEEDDGQRWVPCPTSTASQ